MQDNLNEALQSIIKAYQTSEDAFGVDGLVPLKLIHKTMVDDGWELTLPELKLAMTDLGYKPQYIINPILPIGFYYNFTIITP